MDVREVLYTTRAMRRVKPDPIPEAVQARILDAAIRAPSGGNSQNWAFMLVDDPTVRRQLGPVYRHCLAQLWTGPYAAQVAAAEQDPGSEASTQFRRLQASALHLAEHFEEVPLLLFGFAKHDPMGGSIFPAVWSAMLAARAECVGSALTSVLAIRRDDVMRILDVPPEQGWNMAGCVTLGYPSGRWGVAARRPVHEVAHRNRWGTPVGFEVPTPLWPDPS
jgi:nitroreductase